MADRFEDLSDEAFVTMTENVLMTFRFMVDALPPGLSYAIVLVDDAGRTRTYGHDLEPDEAIEVLQDSIEHLARVEDPA